MNESQELYKKYRPNSFSEMVGNKLAIKTIETELKHGVRVFLLTGQAGIGKTTMARIMAKYVDGRGVNVREINSAENRGIDSAREIMDQMRYRPLSGGSLVWILDEFHQQTKQGQEAFLKPMEDTPDYVYFFICTTNPEKLIVPLKSRCSIISLKPLKHGEMRELLIRTCDAEKTALSADIIDIIIEAAGRSARKGLKLLSRVLYLSDDNEKARALKDAGDAADGTIDFCRVLYGSKLLSWVELAGLLQRMDLSEPERIRYAVLGYGNAILMKKYDSNVVSIMEAFAVNTYDTGKMGLTMMLADAFARIKEL